MCNDHECVCYDGEVYEQLTAALAENERLTRKVGATMRGQEILKEQTVRIRAEALGGAEDTGIDTQDIVRNLRMERNGLLTMVMQLRREQKELREKVRGWCGNQFSHPEIVHRTQSELFELIKQVRAEMRATASGHD